MPVPGGEKNQVNAANLFISLRSEEQVISLLNRHSKKVNNYIYKGRDIYV